MSTPNVRVVIDELVAVGLRLDVREMSEALAAALRDHPPRLAAGHSTARDEGFSRPIEAAGDSASVGHAVGLAIGGEIGGQDER